MSNRDPRLDLDEDFILSKKHNNSITKLLEKQPNGISDAAICRMLAITPDQLADIYESALAKLRAAMGAKDE